MFLHCLIIQFTDHEKNTSGDVNTKHEDSDKLSPKKHLLPVKNQSAQEQKPLLLPTVFRCGVCPQKFDDQSKVVKHVEEEHKTGEGLQHCVTQWLL